jgi:hypothetical protein
MTTTHNLDINTYSLEEIFGLFDLDYGLTEEKMRKAKMKVLMIHPDKSRLPATYFHFYKQAYEIVLNIYKQKNKGKQSTTYTPDVETSSSSSIGNNSSTTPSIDVSKVSKAKFNELYEQNMTKTVDTSRFEWFKNDQPAVFEDFSKRQVNPKNMGSELEALKQKQASLMVYKGVQEMRSGGGTSYFDEEDGDEYVASDIFGRLKFDDLRKVHKDQTVFAVSEADFNKRPQYKTVDQFIRDRDSGGNAPLSKMEAASMLERQQKEKEQQIMNKQYRDYMLQKEYEAKQNAVRSAFLQLH